MGFNLGFKGLSEWLPNGIWSYLFQLQDEYIKWTNKIINKELSGITKQKPIEIQIKKRKWNWIGHTVRKEAGAIEKTAMDWNPQGYRRRGRPKRTWRRTIKDKIRNTGSSWNEVKGIAGDRNAWKPFMDALCSIRSKRN